MTENLPERVVAAVAETTGRPPTELPPLYEAIDPDALAEIAGERILIRFEYAGCRITIEGETVSACEQVSEVPEGPHE